MSVSLDILMVSHVPLVRELGAGRVQLELAEELRALGHRVETFDTRDAGGRAGFERAARAFVRSEGHRFDVVDAHHGALPFSKRDLRYEGLLVARTSGLYVYYIAFRRMELQRWRSLVPGGRLAHLRRRVHDVGTARRCRASLEHADLILPLTEDERVTIRERLRIDSACTPVPNGLSAAHADALAKAARPAADRLAAREVAFVGSWSLRKGEADWERIVVRTRELAPGARFKFVGTWESPERVRRSLGSAAGAAVEIVPEYAAEALPALLAGSTAAALPSYAEGWGLGLLEGLASGLPSVAYDVSGPRAMLGPVTPPALVPAGDADGMAVLLSEILTAEPEDYARRAEAARSAAAPFGWAAIATQTVAAYRRALAEPAR